MEKAGLRLGGLLGHEGKHYYYQTIAIAASSLALDDDASEEDLALISRITPTIVNIVVGTMDEVGLNKNAQYTIVLGKEKQND